MKKILILGWYGTVGSLVAKDLLKSGFSFWIGGRNEQKIDELIGKLGGKNIEKSITDFSSVEDIAKSMKWYDIILNCVEYTLNEMILAACIQEKKDYIDLGDYYEGILHSRSLDSILKENHSVACLGAGSSPWIINVMIAHLAQKKEHIEEVVISFSDIIKNADETMLPFNFQTVVEEIIGDALAYENGEYTFVPGSTKEVAVDFGEEFWKSTCYVTNHDEQYSIPVYLKNKGIKNCYFVMNHSPIYLKLVPLLGKLDFFSEDKIQVNGAQISPLDFLNSYMKKFLPSGFQSDDREILFAKLDDETIGVINNSVEWVPAGIINTAIGASLISQFLATHDISPGVHHPEDFVDSNWMISELKKRNFEIQINGKNI